MSRDVAVVGVGQTEYAGQHRDKSHPELTFEAATKALDHAGLTRDDLDAIVFGTMDPFDGVNRPDKWEAGGAGAFGKAYMKTSTGGTTGLSTGINAYHQLAGGPDDVEIAMAICTQRVGEGEETQPILNTVYDPFFDRPLGVGAISQAAFQATRYEDEFGLTDEQRAAVSVKNRQNAFDNPLSHLYTDIDIDDVLESPLVTTPFHLHECPPSSDGSMAVIMAIDDRATEIRDNPAWITGEIEIADNKYLGDRPDLAYWGSLAVGAKKLYREVGVDDPFEYYDVAELYSPFSTREIMNLEALGFAEKGEAKSWALEGITHRDGEMPIDPSGGNLSSHPIGATGLIKLAEASLQVMGEAGDRQIDGVETALAQGCGGNIQLNSLMSLSAHRR